MFKELSWTTNIFKRTRTQKVLLRPPGGGVRNGALPPLPQKHQIPAPLFIETGTLKRTFRVRVLFKMFVVAGVFEWVAHQACMSWGVQQQSWLELSYCKTGKFHAMKIVQIRGVGRFWKFRDYIFTTGRLFMSRTYQWGIRTKNTDAASSRTIC